MSSRDFGGLKRSSNGRQQIIQESSKERCSSEYQCCGQPVINSEGVLEVVDREQKTGKLPQSHHQGDKEGRALCCQDKDATNAYVLCDAVPCHVEPHDRHRHTQDLYRCCGQYSKMRMRGRGREGLTRSTEGDDFPGDVWSKQKESW